MFGMYFYRGNESFPYFRQSWNHRPHSIQTTGRLNGSWINACVDKEKYPHLYICVRWPVVHTNVVYARHTGHAVFVPNLPWDNEHHQICSLLTARHHSDVWSLDNCVWAVFRFRFTHIFCDTHTGIPMENEIFFFGQLHPLCNLHNVVNKLNASGNGDGCSLSCVVFIEYDCRQFSSECVRSRFSRVCFLVESGHNYRITLRTGQWTMNFKSSTITWRGSIFLAIHREFSFCLVSFLINWQRIAIQAFELMNGGCNTANSLEDENCTFLLIFCFGIKTPDSVLSTYLFSVVQWLCLQMCVCVWFVASCELSCPSFQFFFVFRKTSVVIVSSNTDACFRILIGPQSERQI